MEIKETKHRRVGKIISSAVTVLLIVTVCFCLFVIVQVMSRGYVSIGGHSFFKVVTGSMEPNLKVGELIMTDDVPIDDLKLGDVISFRSQSVDMYGNIITHRVVDIGKTAEGQTILLTKGDSNLSADGQYVYQSNYVGKVVWSSGNSKISSFLTFATGSYGFLACVVLPSILIFAVVLSSSVKNIKKDMQRLVEAEQKQKAAAPVQADETYEEMCSRIKQELIEELKGSEESIQSKTE